MRILINNDCGTENFLNVYIPVMYQIIFIKTENIAVDKIVSACWERIWTVIQRLLVRAHCVQLFICQQSSLGGICVFIGVDQQLE